MRREYKAYLKDILEAIGKIERYTENMNLEDFSNKEPIKALKEKNIQQPKKIKKSEKVTSDKIKEIDNKTVLQNESKTCPECGSPNVEYESGCFVCHDCG